MSRKRIEALDVKLISYLRSISLPLARFSIFLIFFWFGIIKLIGVSPANPLAEALTTKTIGMQYFDLLFYTLALLECLIGILFLIPRATRLVVPLLIFHMGLVCAPLILLPDYVWQSFLVPTLEGQYIIKNVVVVAIAIGIAASVEPINKTKKLK